jgi:hypothetical protein
MNNNQTELDFEKKGANMLKDCIEKAALDENCIGNITFENEELMDFDISSTMSTS